LAFVDRNLSHPALGRLVDDVLEETKPKPVSWRNWPVMAGAIAASLALIIVGVMSFSFPADQMMASYDTVIGERSTLILADGSTLTLNTNSKVEVDFSDEERSINLVRGQALFEVAKNKNWPFVVKAGNQRITALGTAFDVRLDNSVKEVRVVLVEGRVAVDEFSEDERSIIADKRVELVPGDRLVSVSNIKRTVGKTDLDLAISWREGRIVFRGENIKDAISEINRYSVDQLRLGADPRLKGLNINGVFDAGRITSFASALEAMHSVKAQRTSKNEITLVWRD